MKVEQRKLIDIIGVHDTVFQVPIYQRVYSWTQRQCEELWADILRAAGTDGEHFIGTVLYGEGYTDSASTCNAIDLIDGQQRVTTASLLLVAIRNMLQAQGESIDGLDAVTIESHYLFAECDGKRCAKLVLSKADMPTYEALLNRSDLPGEDELSSNLTDNLSFFEERITDCEMARKAWNGLQKLLVIGAQLEEGDQPQTVFESLNSKGMGLSPADLIRNLLFVRFGYDDQKRLYGQYWEPIEQMFPADEDIPDLYLDAALHAWLEKNAPNLKIQNKSEIYSAFKTYVRENPDIQLEDLLRNLNGFCREFASNLDSIEAKKHIDWVRGKLIGLVSERKLFGD